MLLKRFGLTFPEFISCKPWSIINSAAGALAD